MVFSHSCDKRLIELLRILIILGSLYGMAVNDLKILVQLFIFKCSCHITTPLHCYSLSIMYNISK